MSKIRSFFLSAKEKTVAIIDNGFGKLAVAATLGLSAVQAHAAVDVSGITATLVDIGLVGTAMFGAYVAIKATKLVRRAL